MTIVWALVSPGKHAESLVAPIYTRLDTFYTVVLRLFDSGSLEHRSSIHAACCAGSGRRANTCRLWTTAQRRRSNTFFRTPQ
jgi:hypothetical protein